jgi:CIC family chloride channel protein
MALPAASLLFLAQRYVEPSSAPPAPPENATTQAGRRRRVLPLSAAPRSIQVAWARLGERIPDLLLRLGLGETPVLILIGALVGLLAGVAILGFYRLLALAGTLAADLAVRLALPPFLIHAAVLLAGIGLARALVRFGTRDSPGESVPAVMHAVARQGGRLALPPILVKTLAAALLIGSGGSVGAEGPVAVLGAGTASGTGRWLRFQPDRLRLLVGCGAAAGISGAFGAPIAGLFFAVEKILGSMRSASFAPLVVASVTAAAVTRNLLGPHTMLVRMAPVTDTWGTADLILSALLGLVGGLVSVGYTRGIWLGRDLLARVSIPARVAIGAIGVAAIYALVPPALLGVGPLDVGGLAAAGLTLLLLAVAAKIVATSLSLAAAEVGGLFTPAIVTGAALGAAGGVALQQAGLGGGLAPSAYALVGMAALVAGSAHAPLTAIFIVLEMTGDWGLILPLLLAGALSYVMARSLYPNSVYSEWLVRRGERISQGTDESVLGRLRVADAYDPRPVSLAADQPLREALRVIGGSSQGEFPVVDAAGRLAGIVALEDWRRELLTPGPDPARTVAAIARAADVRVTPGESLLVALRRMNARDLRLLPVVADDRSDRLLGSLSRKEIFAVYERQFG